MSNACERPVHSVSQGGVVRRCNAAQGVVDSACGVDSSATCAANLSRRSAEAASRSIRALADGCHPRDTLPLFLEALQLAGAPTRCQYASSRQLASYHGDLSPLSTILTSSVAVPYASCALQGCRGGSRDRGGGGRRLDSERCARERTLRAVPQSDPPPDSQRAR